VKIQLPLVVRTENYSVLPSHRLMPPLLDAGSLMNLILNPSAASIYASQLTGTLPEIDALPLGRMDGLMKLFTSNNSNFIVKLLHQVASSHGAHKSSI